MKEDDTPNGFNSAVLRLHFPEFSNALDVSMCIYSTVQAYSEFVFLEDISNQLEAIANVFKRFQNNTTDKKSSYRLADQIGIDLSNILRTRNLNVLSLVQQSDSAIEVITSNQTGSWLLDLLGKINPIKAIIDLLKLIRDWAPDRESKQIRNSILKQQAVLRDVHEITT